VMSVMGVLSSLYFAILMFLTPQVEREHWTMSVMGAVHVGGNEEREAEFMELGEWMRWVVIMGGMVILNRGRAGLVICLGSGVKVCVVFKEREGRGCAATLWRGLTETSRALLGLWEGIGSSKPKLNSKSIRGTKY